MLVTLVMSAQNTLERLECILKVNYTYYEVLINLMKYATYYVTQGIRVVTRWNGSRQNGIHTKWYVQNGKTFLKILIQFILTKSHK